MAVNLTMGALAEVTGALKEPGRRDSSNGTVSRRTRRAARLLAEFPSRSSGLMGQASHRHGRQGRIGASTGRSATGSPCRRLVSRPFESSAILGRIDQEAQRAGDKPRLLRPRRLAAAKFLAGKEPRSLRHGGRVGALDSRGLAGGAASPTDSVAIRGSRGNVRQSAAIPSPTVSGFLGGLYFERGAESRRCRQQPARREEDGARAARPGLLAAGFSAAVPPGRPPLMPEWAKQAIDACLGPIPFTLAAFLVLVAFYVFRRRVLVRPAVAWATCNGDRAPGPVADRS